MKHLLTFVAISFMLFSLQSCNSMTDSDRKLLAEQVVQLIGVDQICLAEPLQHYFDPNKPDEIGVIVTLSNSNNFDVVSSGNISLSVYMREINSPHNIIGESRTAFYIPTGTVFPKNKANAYTTPPFIKVDSYRKLNKGEQYIIEVRKGVTGAPFSADNLPPYNNSCYYYKYSITL
jgi:hypothetical protein